ncbi:VirB3 family type IV secretion system protein [Sporomusa sphaeroides]|uniref:Type IV secretory pathway, VirB3-like protein n=1 Tax=Sporomusa sphaeroides DSM 2875 TaxID=1337886 RepID=A0A1U7M9W9_9FIRM|nr:VirB3 family type IV secretion system protein [Sporomusa sphaeroides]OLS54303.1 type IV secretory pathway, VirB3-like protein [Sporomusa sphaeroides DSM 2875]CVK21533.1 Type IV secretory pathway, VirB3-like protein [Sporomusa sphaeroides DSM 2875]
MEKPQGFSIPIRKSLTEQILYAGVPREIAILNVTLAAVFALGLRAVYLVVINLLIHYVAYVRTKKDPQFFECFRRHFKQKEYYSS